MWKRKFRLNVWITIYKIFICLDMHRVKSEHCKDDDDDDITDDERKSDQLLNHPGAMQSGNFHRGKIKTKTIFCNLKPIKSGWWAHFLARAEFKIIEADCC